MNEEPREKPIRTLLQDISSNIQAPQAPRGLVPPKLLNRITIFMAILSLLLIVATLLAMIWDLLDPFLGLKFMASVLVVMCALLAFSAINVQFVD